MQYTSLRRTADQWGTVAGSIRCNDMIASTERYRLVDIKELIHFTGDSRSGAYSKMNPRSDYYDPEHPVGVKIGKGAVRYRLDEILTYIETRPRARDVETEGDEE